MALAGRVAVWGAASPVVSPLSFALGNFGFDLFFYFLLSSARKISRDNTGSDSGLPKQVLSIESRETEIFARVNLGSSKKLQPFPLAKLSP